MSNSMVEKKGGAHECVWVEGGGSSGVAGVEECNI